MANDSGLTGWTLMLPVGGNEHLPCYQHPTKNKAIVVSWDDVPEQAVLAWANQGYVEALFQLGKIYFEREQYEKAWELFSKGAEKNDKFSIFYLGVMLDGGLGIEANRQLALKKFHLSADLGHSDSQYNIAQAYLRGTEVQQDIQKAVYYFTLAGSQGDAESNYNLGIFYFVGDLIPKDYTKALTYFELALANGFSEAQKFINEIKSANKEKTTLSETGRFTKFVCLANSFKEGGRCLAGIELDANNNPVMVNGRPKWIRPVCNTPHGEVPNHIAGPFSILNILEIQITGNQPQGYQSENVTFNENSIRVVGNFNINHLQNLCDNRNLIFSNRGKAVSQEQIVNLSHSLLLISATEFEITQRTYDNRPDRPQTRLHFTYNGNSYDFPVTDPVFLHRYQANPDVLENINQIYLSLSLGVEWQSWYYKLVAAIIPNNNVAPQIQQQPVDDLPF